MFYFFYSSSPDKTTLYTGRGVARQHPTGMFGRQRIEAMAQGAVPPQPPVADVKLKGLRVVEARPIGQVGWPPPGRYQALQDKGQQKRRRSKFEQEEKKNAGRVMEPAMHGDKKLIRQFYKVMEFEMAKCPFPVLLPTFISTRS